MTGDGKRTRSELSRGGSTGVLVDGARYQAGDGGSFGGAEVRERVITPNEGQEVAKAATHCTLGKKMRPVLVELSKPKAPRT